MTEGACSTARGQSIGSSRMGSFALARGNNGSDSNAMPANSRHVSYATSASHINGENGLGISDAGDSDAAGLRRGALWRGDADCGQRLRASLLRQHEQAQRGARRSVECPSECACSNWGVDGSMRSSGFGGDECGHIKCAEGGPELHGVERQASAALPDVSELAECARMLASVSGRLAAMAQHLSGDSLTEVALAAELLSSASFKATSAPAPLSVNSQAVPNHLPPTTTTTTLNRQDRTFWDVAAECEADLNTLLPSRHHLGGTAPDTMAVFGATIAPPPAGPEEHARCKRDDSWPFEQSAPTQAEASDVSADNSKRTTAELVAGSRSFTRLVSPVNLVSSLVLAPINSFGRAAAAVYGRTNSMMSSVDGHAVSAPASRRASHAEVVFVNNVLFEADQQSPTLTRKNSSNFRGLPVRVSFSGRTPGSGNTGVAGVTLQRSPSMGIAVPRSIPEAEGH